METLMMTRMIVMVEVVVLEAVVVVLVEGTMMRMRLIIMMMVVVVVVETKSLCVAQAYQKLRGEESIFPIFRHLDSIEHTIILSYFQMSIQWHTPTFSYFFLCQTWISSWKNQDIGTRDGICGGKMGKSKQLPKCHTVTKCTFLNGILLSNIHFSLNFIQNHFFTN